MTPPEKITLHNGPPDTHSKRTSYREALYIAGISTFFPPWIMKKNIFIKKIVEAISECIKEELANLLVAIRQLSVITEQKFLDSLYLTQIAAAQNFLEHDRNTDLSRLKCLLRCIMPKAYHDKIDELHEREDRFVCIINGGQNLIAPNARQAEQKSEDDAPKS